jgi:hypothetical protein
MKNASAVISAGVFDSISTRVEITVLDQFEMIDS